MPNKIKHSRETREKVYNLYWHGREPGYNRRGLHGTYTLKQIEEMTGVPASTAGKIARGCQ
jgi:hypothetical protein